MARIDYLQLNFATPFLKLDAISSLLSESYSRAYRAMVSMQILAEMEEVVELKQSTSKPNIEVSVA